MDTNKGISIYFAPDDVAEMREFLLWKTKRAAALNFSADDFSLAETSQLIAQARQEMQTERDRKWEIQRQDQIVADQRNSISKLEDRVAERQEKLWAEEARIQGEEYSQSRNSGASGRAYITPEEKSIRDEVISWIERQKRRGHFGGQKSLRK